MTDPFEALRAPLGPIDPDPLFAAHLRAQLARALRLPKGVTVSDLALDDPEVPILPAETTASADATVSAPPAGIVPYLAVADARRAIEWYVEVLGGYQRGEPIEMSDGRIGHAEIDVRGRIFYLADESPASSHIAPRPGAGATVSLMLQVDDVAGLADQAVSAGAILERPPADNPYGRNAVIRDPFGHRWIMSAPQPAAVPPDDPVREGDIGYVSLWVPDAERAATFFGQVLSWSYRPGRRDQGRQVEGLSLHHGLWGGQARSTLFLCYVVDDMTAAVDRVRAAGGQAEEPEVAPYGLVSNCVDDQGTPFAVYRPPPDQPRARRGPLNGSRHGDVSYVTLEVQDSAKARAFYAAVLGWHFSPGRVSDGWTADDVVPMTGLHGGHPEATTLPMYRVDDIAAAVERVRALGGSATVPEGQSYGLMCECVDDQGTRFFLGQH